MSEADTILISSDHAGYRMKEFVKRLLDSMNVPYEDLGAHREDPDDDYPVFAARVGQAVSDGRRRRGITVCGTGIGASIVANRYRGVRAALCTSAETARMARTHNDANVLVLGGRITSEAVVADIVKIWLATPFEGGRHQRRIELLEKVTS
jgi:ribose 5-phosphate isomerase B